MNVKKLSFPDYNCKILENGDVSFFDHYAEHMIYVYKSEWDKIIKAYNDSFEEEK